MSLEKKILHSLYSFFPQPTRTISAPLSNPLQIVRCTHPQQCLLSSALLCLILVTTRTCHVTIVNVLLRTFRAYDAATSAVMTSARPASRSPLASSQTVPTLLRSKSVWTVTYDRSVNTASAPRSPCMTSRPAVTLHVRLGEGDSPRRNPQLTMEKPQKRSASRIVATGRRVVASC